MTEKLQSFYGGVMTGIKGDQLPPFASPFGANATIERIAEQQGKVRRRKGALTRSYQPLSGEPEVLGIFSYPASDGNKILVVGADGSLQVEDEIEQIPIMPDFYPIIGDMTIPATGSVGVALAFSAYAYDPDPMASIAAYRWDAGDLSGIQLGNAITHAYGAPGTYTVTLTVEDDTGNTTQQTAEVVIT